jgi:hypothetical protein
MYYEDSSLRPIRYIAMGHNQYFTISKFYIGNRRVDTKYFLIKNQTLMVFSTIGMFHIQSP